MGPEIRARCVQSGFFINVTLARHHVQIHPLRLRHFSPVPISQWRRADPQQGDTAAATAGRLLCRRVGERRRGRVPLFADGVHPPVGAFAFLPMNLATAAVGLRVVGVVSLADENQPCHVARHQCCDLVALLTQEAGALRHDGERSCTPPPTSIATLLSTNLSSTDRRQRLGFSDIEQRRHAVPGLRARPAPAMWFGCSMWCESTWVGRASIRRSLSRGDLAFTALASPSTAAVRSASALSFDRRRLIASSRSAFLQRHDRTRVSGRLPAEHFSG